MPARHLLPFVFLGFILALAGLLALGWTVWWLAPVYWLGQYPLFHIVAHFSIFAGVVMLYGSRKRRAIRLWLLVFGGSILLEWVQFEVGGLSLTRPVLLNGLFDIAVDVAGAGVCWLALGVRSLNLGLVKNRSTREITG